MDAQAFREIQVFAPVWRPHRGEPLVCVRSETDPAVTYTVQMPDKIARDCSCPHHQIRRARCKHMRLAELGRAWWGGACVLLARGRCAAEVATLWRTASEGAKGAEHAVLRFAGMAGAEGGSRRKKSEQIATQKEGSMIFLKETFLKAKVGKERELTEVRDLISRTSEDDERARLKARAVRIMAEIEEVDGILRQIEQAH